MVLSSYLQPIKLQNFLQTTELIIKHERHKYFIQLENVRSDLTYFVI